MSTILMSFAVLACLGSVGAAPVSVNKDSLLANDFLETTDRRPRDGGAITTDEGVGVVSTVIIKHYKFFPQT